MHVSNLVILGGSHRIRHFRSFSLADVANFRPEVASHVISGEIVDPTSINVVVNFGDYRSRGSRDIRLPHFVTNEQRGTTPACAGYHI